MAALPHKLRLAPRGGRRQRNRGGSRPRPAVGDWRLHRPGLCCRRPGAQLAGPSRHAAWHGRAQPRHRRSGLPARLDRWPGRRGVTCGCGGGAGRELPLRALPGDAHLARHPYEPLRGRRGVARGVYLDAHAPLAPGRDASHAPGQLLCRRSRPHPHRGGGQPRHAPCRGLASPAGKPRPHGRRLRASQRRRFRHHCGAPGLHHGCTGRACGDPPRTGNRAPHGRPARGVPHPRVRAPRDWRGPCRREGRVPP